MSVKFKEEGHLYQSIVPDNIDWISVTSLVSSFKQPFDTKKKSESSSKNKKSKWYGMTPQEIQQAWSNEAKRSTDLGTWYHNQREQDLTSHSTITVSGKPLPIVRPIYKDEFKIAPDQKLQEGIYPEHFVYLKSIGICGQSDLVEIINGKVNILDYKTNKEIKVKGFVGWDGKVQRMSYPLSRLDDCHLMHYNLQLSLYMYIILKHNPKLSPGKLSLSHIRFKEQDRDKHDNPVYLLDSQGNFIVDEVIPYDLPYLKADVISLIQYLQDNRSKIKTKKQW